MKKYDEIIIIKSSLFATLSICYLDCLASSFIENKKAEKTTTAKSRKTISL